MTNQLPHVVIVGAVSKELLQARKEATRVSAQGLEQGIYLRSRAELTAAQELEAQTLLLQSQLEYPQAQDELTEALDRRHGDCTFRPGVA